MLGGILKLALVIHSLAGGGAERVMSLLANAWAARGIDVSLVTIGPTTGDTYELDRGIRRIGLDLMGVSDGPVAALLNNMRRVRRLRAVMRELQPDVLVSFLSTTNALSVLAARPLKLPVIVSERIWPGADGIGRAWRCLRKYAYRRATLVVSQTHRTAQWLKEEIPGASVEVVANPVQVECQKSVDEVVEKMLASCAGYNLVLAAGRLSAQKGFDLLIRAFAPLVRERPNWMLVIFGEGEERDSLYRLCRELNVADRVLMPGFSVALHVVMRRTQLFVLPSRYEGMPNALAEAMACGTPCISFDCPTGPAELISDGRNGLLVPAGDIFALSSAMDRLMRDERLRESLGSAARESMKVYSMDNVLNRWNALLERAVNSTEARIWGTII